MLNVIIFGAPGAGKGTQSKLLIEKYGLTHLSTGDILRNEISENTELGQHTKSIIEQGKLVPDDVICKIIEKKISEITETNGFMFDGFPRTVNQAKMLEDLLTKMNMSVAVVINLDVPREELVSRMLLRAKNEDRPDDNVETINKRFDEYENKTVPVADFYRLQNKLSEINGLGSIEDIFKRIESVVGKYLID